MTEQLEPEPDDPKPIDPPCLICKHPTSAHEWDYGISWTVCRECRDWGGECEP